MSFNAFLSRAASFSWVLMRLFPRAAFFFFWCVNDSKSFYMILIYISVQRFLFYLYFEAFLFWCFFHMSLETLEIQKSLILTFFSAFLFYGFCFFFIWFWCFEAFSRSLSYDFWGVKDSKEFLVSFGVFLFKGFLIFYYWFLMLLHAKAFFSWRF